ncbi:MAG: hypothetical protein V4725_00820 [Bacteroidota bacterium]
MKRVLTIVGLFGLLLLNSQKAQAQFSWNDEEKPLLYEAGISAGIMNCLTDLGGNAGKGAPFLKDLNIGNNRLNGSLYFSAIYKYMIGFRLEGTIGQVKAYDSILKDVAATSQGRYQRNLHFRSKIHEVSAVAELHLLTMFREFVLREDRNAEGPPRFSPYFLGGIGFFSFNPQASLRGNWINLEPLRTEGQGFSEYPDRTPYKLNGICIPLGAGIKYEVNPALGIRLEVIHRVLSTDYLDDVSTRYINPNVFQKYFSGVQLQNVMDLKSNDRVNPGGPDGTYRKSEGGRRGDPTDTDAYFTLNLKFGLTIGGGRRVNSALRQVQCPTRF